MGHGDKIELDLLACSWTEEQKAQLVREAVVPTDEYSEGGKLLPR